jgi:malate dehydrogenase (oxaloacetate-decarboxylating)
MILYHKEAPRNISNPQGLKGTISKAMGGADIFIGLSQPGVIHQKDVRKMSKDAILFAMANHVPEIMPEETPRNLRVIATGRSDYSNQINNVLCFPGLFRGVLDCNAKEINDEMLFATSKAITSIVTDGELREDYIIPSVFNLKVSEKVSVGVKETAIQTGVARLEHSYLSFYKV